MKIEDTSPLGVAGLCTAALLAVLVGSLVAFLFWYRCDSAENRGFTFGYYGTFNTVSNALASLPGVTVLGAGYNADVTLEEFGFRIMARQNRELDIWFAERDPIRRMSGRQLARELEHRIGEMSPN